MAEKHVLVLNCGSSSLKFAIINVDSGEQILTGMAEYLGLDKARIAWQLGNQNFSNTLESGGTHPAAIEQLLAIIEKNDLASCLLAVGHRVVHGGEKFTQSVVVNDEVLEIIARLSDLAPLHNPANLIGIQAALTGFPHLPQVAVFDTAFHQTIEQHAYLYALPYKLYRDHSLRRYGFHGTSHYYVSREAARMLDKPITETNLITVHLGNGCSIAAIKYGESVDTSMGLTPLEGLVMGTRSGDVDPGLILYLCSELNYSHDEVDDLLNKKSGLLGLSELSNDCRTLIEAADNGNRQAHLALEVFCYRLAKYIASYFVALDSLDAIVFTGGIGENSEYVRRQVMNKMKILGLELDQDKNMAARFGQAGCISSSALKALVIPTNEEQVIAEDSYRLTKKD